MVSFQLFVQSFLVVLSTAFYTLLERKVLGYIQTRKGPNKPSAIGILVPFRDALKLITKENNKPTNRNMFLFMRVPYLLFLLPLLLWCVYPSLCEVTVLKFSILWFICVSSVRVYGLLGSGWGRNRKYSLLGSVRSVAQTVSYEVRLAVTIIHVIIFYFFQIWCNKTIAIGSFLFIMLMVLFVTALAETNRSPFDFSEGESELVRGFNTEFRAIPFILIFLGEYMSILFMSSIVSLLFCCTGIIDFSFFTLLCGVGYIWCRGTLPRFRYDQLMHLAWKGFLPTTLCSLGFVLVI